MRFPGIIPALTTPFGADGAVDHAALERNATALLDAGVHGFVATGTMGEAGSLSAAERRAVIATAVERRRRPRARDRRRLLRHAGAVDRLRPRRRRRGRGRDHAPARRSATAATSARRSPSTARSPTAPDLPIMLYNNPEASGTDLPAALIARIAAEVDQVVAVKECSGDARRIPAILAAAPHLEVLVGGDDWALEGFASGATGWVSGVADCVPADCVALYEACLAADFETRPPDRPAPAAALAGST